MLKLGCCCHAEGCTYTEGQVDDHYPPWSQDLVVNHNNGGGMQIRTDDHDSAIGIYEEAIDAVPPGPSFAAPPVAPLRMRATEVETSQPASQRDHSSVYSSQHDASSQRDLSSQRDHVEEHETTLGPSMFVQPVAKSQASVPEYAFETKSEQTTQASLHAHSSPGGSAANAGDPDGISLGGGAKYTGQWQGQHCHGQGKLLRKDGSYYEGEFHSSQAHGEGRLVLPNGDGYEGQFIRDKAHGYGKYWHADSSYYEGEWLQDEKSGKGMEQWYDGSKYEGHFLRGEKHGEGIFTSEGNLTYEGQFLNDRMDGQGKSSFADGRKHTGSWEKGVMSGEGVMHWTDGSRYDGEFRNDRRHGDGTFAWPDGRMYKGQWIDGKQEGRGTSRTAEGYETTAMWKSGHPVQIFSRRPNKT
eukprot:TRINITY_DN81929_c0_g1_i1.p1 TRINITY_DN81929_c0_g1~~TRINITY_DN81929_c0_g1_i1.p1  ORF type:complete len:412 (-),score=63.49 TRINITY_DN81929_c0_g1_i1:79-1314(-)